MSHFHRRHPLLSRLSSMFPAWVVLGLALCCTAFAWHLSGLHAQEAAQQRFNLRTEQVERAIRSRMLSYETLLSGGAGLFGAVKEVDRRQWRTYVDSLAIDQRYPGILGIGYTQRFAPHELAAHERSVRSEGFPAYSVTPVEPRDEYHAIIYLEPFSGRNLRAFGYDMFSDPTRRAAMSLARDTGLPALSGKVTLVQETERDRQAGCLLYVPVYRDGMSLATVAQRRDALKGFVYAPFRMKDLMRGIMGDQFPDLELEIFDGDSPRLEALLYDSDAERQGSGPRREGLFEATLPFELNHQTWTLRVTSRPEFEALSSPWPRAGILAGGVAISFLLFGITWSLASTQARAKALAQDMTQALRESEARFRAVHDHAAFGIVQTTPEGTIIHSNPAFQRLLGYSEEELNALHWSQLTVLEDHTENHRLRRELLRGERQAYQIEKRYIHKDGRIIWGSVAVTGVRRDDGTLEFLLALIEDITARKQKSDAIAHQAYHDALTGLPNRRRFTERLDQALVKARRNNTPLALLFLDLDHFKDVNDALGHAAGDALLQEIAHRLKSCVRTSDTVARLGGDEFTALLPDVDGSGAIQVAKKILQSLPVSYVIGGKTLTVTPSIGISLYPDHAPDAATLIQLADGAMYASKQAGRNRYTLASAPPKPVSSPAVG